MADVNADKKYFWFLRVVELTMLIAHFSETTSMRKYLCKASVGWITNYRNNFPLPNLYLV